MKKKVAFKTLGCRLNQFETDSLVTDFYKAGYEIVNYGEQADVYVVNTCTVTDQSDQKSKHIINKAVRTVNSNSVIVVTGCMVESKNNYLEDRGDITYVVDNKRKSSILSLIDAHFKGEIINPSDLRQDIFNFSVVEKGFHTRGAIKIQDGCDNFCTYCIVPSVRGRAEGRPSDAILTNIQKNLELGYKELVLTGVNISRYDHNGLSFGELVKQILDLPGDFRVRISSIEPEGFTQKFINLFENPKLCPHLHLCLQSGSDKVLMRMRRFYSIDQYLQLINSFRKKYNDFNFTTDIIVGFPGETDEEFNNTLKVIKEVGFGHIHTFKYSKRTGTKAERLPDQISEKIKSERSRIVRTLSDENKIKYRSSFIGKEQLVLVEKSTKGKGAKGYGQNYIPIEIKNTPRAKNTFCKVLITGILDDKEKTAVGELLS